jgi:hypothetical protein
MRKASSVAVTDSIEWAGKKKPRTQPSARVRGIDAGSF